jgi:hypothetical protein
MNLAMINDLPTDRTGESRKVELLSWLPRHRFYHRSYFVVLAQFITPFDLGRHLRAHDRALGSVQHALDGVHD